MAAMIGIDPHTGSHTAVAIGPSEEPLGRQRVRACPDQARQLLAWAAAWPERTWAVEGATGLGWMLARQLAAAGEQVLDIQPKLAARVRLLEAGDVNKNDPNDARSVAVAALRSRAQRRVAADGHAAVLKSGPSGTVTWPGPATRSPAACTPCCASWSPAASPERSPQAWPPASWTGRRGRAAAAARHDLATEFLATCAAWTPSAASAPRSWPWRSGPAAPR